jgi:hypothetical protein
MITPFVRACTLHAFIGRPECSGPTLLPRCEAGEASFILIRGLGDFSAHIALCLGNRAPLLRFSRKRGIVTFGTAGYTVHCRRFLPSVWATPWERGRIRASVSSPYPSYWLVDTTNSSLPPFSYFCVCFYLAATHIARVFFVFDDLPLENFYSGRLESLVGSVCICTCMAFA